MMTNEELNNNILKMCKVIIYHNKAMTSLVCVNDPSAVKVADNLTVRAIESLNQVSKQVSKD